MGSVTFTFSGWNGKCYVYFFRIKWEVLRLLFQDEMGSVTCTSCPSGTSTLSTGATSTENCIGNHLRINYYRYYQCLNLLYLNIYLSVQTFILTSNIVKVWILWSIVNKQRPFPRNKNFTEVCQMEDIRYGTTNPPANWMVRTGDSVTVKCDKGFARQGQAVSVFPLQSCLEVPTCSSKLWAAPIFSL